MIADDLDYCGTCDGEGTLESAGSALSGDASPFAENHLITCPDCKGRGSWPKTLPDASQAQPTTHITRSPSDAGSQKESTS